MKHSDMVVMLSCLWLLVLGIACNRSSSPEEVKQPTTKPTEGVLSSAGKVTSPRQLRTVDHYLMLCAPGDKKIQQWDWADTQADVTSISLLHKIGLSCSFLSPTLVVMDAHRSETAATSPTCMPVVLDDLAQMKTARIWEIEGNWYCDSLISSGDGRFVAVGLMEAPHSDPDHPKIRVGLIDGESRNLTWAATLTGDFVGQFMFSGAIPSRNGKYIVIPGYNNRIALVDVAKQRTVWRLEVGDSTVIDAAFTPDEKTVFTGGGMDNFIYGIDCKTGKITSKWELEEYAGRIVAVAVSPDGKYLAVGTGSVGKVLVWSIATGECVASLTHSSEGTIYGLAFSPDSRRLATGGTRGGINLWSLPELGR